MIIQVNRREVNTPLSIQLNATEVPIKLRTFVELTMDVASASPRRYFFEASILSSFSCLSKSKFSVIAAFLLILLCGFCTLLKYFNSFRSMSLRMPKTTGQVVTTLYPLFWHYPSSLLL